LGQLSFEFGYLLGVHFGSASRLTGLFKTNRSALFCFFHGANSMLAFLFKTLHGLLQCSVFALHL
jgi:hypothetical protein